ncbi:MAG: hypothetical protein QXO70_04970 [Candidatus Pacearchaeota archaeon]
MIPDFKVKLEMILAKDKSALTAGDKIFLKARKMYLNKKQLSNLSDVLEEEVEVETVKADPTDVLPEGEHPSYRDLQRRASELGMKEVVGQTREQLEKYIKNNEPK